MLLFCISFPNSNICDMLRVESLRKIIYILLSIRWKDALKLTKSLRFTENVKTWIANQGNKQYVFENLNV